MAIEDAAKQEIIPHGGVSYQLRVMIPLRGCDDMVAKTEMNAIQLITRSSQS